MTLKRLDRTYRGKPTHYYELDGVKVPGVTSLLSGGLPKPALVGWAAKMVAEFVADNDESVRTMLDTLSRDAVVAELKGKPWAERDKAAARGTDVHALAERLVHGEDVEVPDDLLGAVEGYARWLDQWQVEPVLTERPCASREWFYAGTFDGVLRFGRGPLAGGLTLADWKTSKGVYGETALQLAAYAGSEFYLDEAGDECPMPDIDHLAVVHITPTGTDLYPVTDRDAAWRAWTHVQYVAKQADAIKHQITTPLPIPA